MTDFKSIEESAKRVAASIEKTNASFRAFAHAYAEAEKKQRRLRFDNRWLFFWRGYYWLTHGKGSRLRKGRIAHEH